MLIRIKCLCLLARAKSQVRQGQSLPPDSILRQCKCFWKRGTLALNVYVADRCLSVCFPNDTNMIVRLSVVHACVRVISRGSRPTSRPTPVISRISPFSSHIYCLSHTHMAMAVHTWLYRKPNRHGPRGSGAARGKHRSSACRRVALRTFGCSRKRWVAFVSADFIVGSISTEIGSALAPTLAVAWVG